MIDEISQSEVKVFSRSQELRTGGTVARTYICFKR